MGAGGDVCVPMSAVGGESLELEPAEMTMLMMPVRSNLACSRTSNVTFFFAFFVRLAERLRADRAHDLAFPSGAPCVTVRGALSVTAAGIFGTSGGGATTCGLGVFGTSGGTAGVVGMAFGTAKCSGGAPVAVWGPSTGAGTGAGAFQTTAWGLTGAGGAPVAVGAAGVGFGTAADAGAGGGIYG